MIYQEPLFILALLTIFSFKQRVAMADIALLASPRLVREQSPSPMANQCNGGGDADYWPAVSVLAQH